MLNHAASDADVAHLVVRIHDLVSQRQKHPEGIICLLGRNHDTLDIVALAGQKVVCRVRRVLLQLVDLSDLVEKLLLEVGARRLGGRSTHATGLAVHTGDDSKWIHHGKRFLTQGT